MCGIAGLWTFGGGTDAELFDAAQRMADTLVHRGPDDAGVWVDAAAGVALGFRRLAILDLSPTGHQPMESADGRYVIVFNGEIYNFADLRAGLEARGGRFRGTSDTEVILASCVEVGVPETLRRCWGMFGLAIWDRHERSLILARDRVGKKPLYYSLAPDLVLFGSELKALRAHPAFEGSIDRDSVASYARFGYVPGPHSIYRNTWKLMPGCFAEIRPGAPARIQTYWDPLEVATRPRPAAATPADALEELESLLRDSIRRRMIADVPVGAFLSGGLDSSTVVALMQAESTRPIRTFTIGFPVSGYNEAEAARAVASHLHTEHTELYVTPGEAMGVIPRLADMYDEPFGDSSQIPTSLVSALAVRDVTVALSGDGGDELFGGYTRYRWASTIWDRLRLLPGGIRRTGGRALRAVSSAEWDRWYARTEIALPSAWRQSLFGDKVHKIADLLGVDSPDALYRGLVSTWARPEDLVRNGTEYRTILDDTGLRACLPDFVDRMMFLDLVSYLPGDILAKVDRASMGASLEARAPLLDHRLIEYAWTLPQTLKYHGGTGKWLLRQLLYKYVPRELVDRPKMGFGIPIDVWLRGPLRDWAEALLDERRLREEGMFDSTVVRQTWCAHLAGRQNQQARLWTVLMFQAWRERWVGSA
jgi:asparagine synthase (glutamine-hydrolysing)